MWEKLALIDELSIEIAEEVNEYISEKYPWSPTRMDFSRIHNHTHFYWGKTSNEQAEQFIKSSNLSDFDYVAILYSYRKPMKIFTFDYAAKELDYISLAEQIYIVFGVVKNGLEWEVHKNRFAYIHSGRDIWVIGRENMP